MQKKIEPETFEAKMLEEASFSTIQGMVKQDKAEDIVREADQRIAALSAQLEASEAAQALYAASVPLEADELIDFLEEHLGMGLLPADIKEHDRLLVRYEELFKEGKRSAPLELVELVEELIDWIVGANSAPADPQLVVRAQATIERWKV